ncbi:MAG: inner-membrane translocator [Clostridia bacterium]|nr:inner-membrane translocator [Clostridia bacterium]
MKEANVEYGLKVIINQSVVVALVATGAVFIYTLGSFDISLGAATGVSALLGAMAYNATGSLWLMFFTCVGVALAIGIINSSLASVFNLPIFVTTVAMMSVLSAFMLILIGLNGKGDTIRVKARDVRPLDTIELKVGILIAYTALCWFIFTLLPTGREAKFIGGNPLCARLSGINEKKLAVIASLVCSLGIGLGAFLSIVYAPTLNRNTASSIGMDVIIAIVFGGMPVSGGPRSRIFSALVGAFSMGFLSQIMSFLNLGSGYGQMIKAAIFLLVVFIALGSQRGKLLTR